jgi:Holliday junction resolvasome RuvABC ATP-dependent DNA helicase subunit
LQSWFKAILNSGGPCVGYLWSHWSWHFARAVRCGEPLVSFLRVIIRYDQLNGTMYAADAVESIRQLGAIMTGHHSAQQAEAATLELYIRLLEGALGEAGLQPHHRSAVGGAKLMTPTTSEAEHGSVTDDDSLRAAMQELETLVGLTEVKQDVVALTNLLRIRQVRQERGLTNPPITLHMVFTGNPGTGKTTVARILARIYKALGVLPAGTFTETDRSGLVAGYVGQTALKVREVVFRARGGILFIDEAYGLAPQHMASDYGGEAIETLLKLMEDHRDELIVVVAGYTDRMAQFLSSNPGLRSRFNKFIEFPDYSPDELTEIFCRMAHAANYEVSTDVATLARDDFSAMTRVQGEHFGNARAVRNYFEDAVSRQANRLASQANLSDNDVAQLAPSDLKRGL